MLMVLGVCSTQSEVYIKGKGKVMILLNLALQFRVPQFKNTQCLAVHSSVLLLVLNTIVSCVFHL
jgi:hypothetical protein